MHFQTYIQLDPAHRAQIRRLWNNEYPRDIHHANQDDTDMYLGGLRDSIHIFFEDNKGNVGAWLSHFYRDGHRNFVMIVDERYQGKGVGSMLLEKAKQITNELHGWIVPEDKYVRSDGKPYRSPEKFYIKNGFKVHKDITSHTHVLSAVKVIWNK